MPYDATESASGPSRLDETARSWLEEQLVESFPGTPDRSPSGPFETARHGTVDPALVALLELAERRGASDLHVDSRGGVPVIRHDGELVELVDIAAVAPEVTQRLLMSALTPRGADALDRFGSADTVLVLPSGARTRANIHRCEGGLAAAFRMLPKSIPAVATLGLPAAAEALAQSPRGLLLVTGSAGSGKTTTIAALIHEVVARLPVHILTLEDPIEYRFESTRALITQRQVGDDVPDFATALKYALRQDPDVLVIGEMRDPETIAAAVTAAETGHLVISTLHSRTAQGTITRIVDAVDDSRQPLIRAQLAGALVGIISQQLVTGTGGTRVLASELLVATSAIRNLIREGAVHQIGAALETGAAKGMQTMDQSLAALVRRGAISTEEANRRCVEPTALRGLLR